MILDKTVFAPSDYKDMPAIRAVHERAFLRAIEPDLAETLIQADDTTLDICAKIDGHVVGHGVLTHLTGPDKALALAPLAVDPEWRDFQIGTEIVRHLIAAARAHHFKSVFVLGDPDFYGRFGFKSELADCVDCEYQGNRFMALELVEGALDGHQGVLEYPQAFKSENRAA